MHVNSRLDASSLFPAVANLRRMTARVATAVVAAARDDGVGRRLADEAIPGAVGPSRKAASMTTRKAMTARTKSMRSSVPQSISVSSA
jgi:hypothetical protein